MNAQTIAVFMIVGGIAILVLNKFISLGNLPGDLYFEGKNWSLGLPLMTCLVISIVLSIVFRMFGCK